MHISAHSVRLSAAHFEQHQKVFNIFKCLCRLGFFLSPHTISEAPLSLSGESVDRYGVWDRPAPSLAGVDGLITITTWLSPAFSRLVGMAFADQTVQSHPGVAAA
jgi:hypothetical protein